METEIFYAIYDRKRKKFKGRGNVRGVIWTDVPTQMYETEGRALGALKSHLKACARSEFRRTEATDVVVIPVTVSWVFVCSISIDGDALAL